MTTDEEELLHVDRPEYLEAREMAVKQLVNIESCVKGMPVGLKIKLATEDYYIFNMEEEINRLDEYFYKRPYSFIYLQRTYEDLFADYTDESTADIEPQHSYLCIDKQTGKPIPFVRDGLNNWLNDYLIKKANSTLKMDSKQVKGIIYLLDRVNDILSEAHNH